MARLRKKCEPRKNPNYKNRKFVKLVHKLNCAFTATPSQDLFLCARYACISYIVKNLLNGRFDGKMAEIK